MFIFQSKVPTLKLKNLPLLHELETLTKKAIHSLYQLLGGLYLQKAQRRDPTKIRTNRTRRTTHRTTQNCIFVLILVCLLNTFFRPATFLSIFVLILVCLLPQFSSSHFAIDFRPYFSILDTIIFVLPFCYQFSSLFQYAGYNHFHPPILVSIIFLILVCLHITFRPYSSWYQPLYSN